MITRLALSTRPNLSVLHSAHLRGFGPAISLSASIESGRQKIIKKIWHVSLNLRHLTRLESTKRSREIRQNARNCAGFTANNFFVFNKSLMLFAPFVQTYLST
jgi:succinate dehydrogenase/fumarate reductase flavoprotein subunit